MNLETFFKQNNKIAIGFSGGVDSAYLLYAGKTMGADIQPYFIKTPFQPQFELDDAYQLCKQLGIDLKVISYDILQVEDVRKNPDNRCYYCKKELFTLLKQQAIQDGYTILIDGTNASDDMDERPGSKAIQELKVLSPLRMCNLSKSVIREKSKEAGLFTWDKPSYACLATRIQANQLITHENLKKVEQAENILHDLGYRDFRVRVYYGAARIQLSKKDWLRFKKEEMLSLLKPIFDIVLLDLEER